VLPILCRQCKDRNQVSAGRPKSETILLRIANGAYHEERVPEVVRENCTNLYEQRDEEYVVIVSAASITRLDLSKNKMLNSLAARAARCRFDEHVLHSE
jgi:hypothetical protein